MAVRVQQGSFDPGAELNALHAANLGIGAVAGFVGYVRDFNDGQDVAGMFSRHAPGMTEKRWKRSCRRPSIAGHCCAWMCCTALDRWSLASRSCSSVRPVPIAMPPSMPVASSWTT